MRKRKWKRRRKVIRKSNGFTIIEILAVIIITGVIFALMAVVIKKGNEIAGNLTCVEWEEVPVMDCYQWYHHTTCENRTERRCVKYEGDN